MANVTDPLACPIHGTNPQNLIEYITRQRIYDSQYWKEQCFGLTAADVAEKAAMHLQAVGSSYGGNSKPTRFLCLILKMLQIQPDEGIIDELINNEEFKYVRALGVFYLRLTGRPAEIYEKMEPLYNDYRKLKYRNHSGWELMYIDEFIDQLLREERVCGIALPRLPKREMLEEAGYLDGPRRSAVQSLIESPEGDVQGINDDRLPQYISGVAKIESLLREMAADGNIAARKALSDRGQNTMMDTEEQRNVTVDQIESDRMDRGMEHSGEEDEIDNEMSYEPREKKRKKEKKTKVKKKFGSLFKSSRGDSKIECDSVSGQKEVAGENSEEYWNEQRAKLGLKPLKK
jgi:hypothetical protein